jgi:predicted lipid-binding transport protein (Tim44 family)
MNKWLASVLVGVIAASFALDADAQRRLGGAKNIGKQSPQVQQRQATPPQQQTPPQAAPAQPGAQQPATAARPAAGAATGAAATAARSPWRGALMGLAAGLGIAALASWLGFGEALTMFLTVLLVGLALMLLLGFVLRRMRGPQPAAAAAGGRGPGTYSQVGYETAPAPMQRTRVEPAYAGSARPGSAMAEFSRGGAASSGPWGIPAGFETAQFLEHAKANFVRLQDAWDRGSLDEMAEFTTNDMFIALTHELRARGGHSKTEVVTLDAELLGIESDANEHVASVKFEGTLRVDGETERVSEVWNLAKPAQGRGGWLLAGIQQMA